VSWSRDRGGRDSYHHGNLREALIEMALALIAEKGPAGFTFAEVARGAGVSPAAPYRHFRDRAALLAEIARRGFERFEAELARAWADGRPEPVAALIACGRAYLRFVRAEPAYYVTMFETGLPLETETDLPRAGERAFAVLRRAAEAVCARMPAAGRPPALMVALHVWSMSHGIASLFLGAGNAARRLLPMEPEDLLEAGVLIYLGALGVPGAR